MKTIFRGSLRAPYWRTARSCSSVGRCALAFLLAVPSTCCTAAVFERDWKASGDGLLTYDDVNRREWLDLSESLLSHFAGPQLDNALAEIRPGGLFDGFTWATKADVTALSQSAGIDTSSFDYSTNHVATSRLIELLGANYQYSDSVLTETSSRGFVQPINPSDALPPPVPPSSDGAFFDVRFFTTTGQGVWAGVGIGRGDDFFEIGGSRNPSYVSLMLSRAVPEPPTILLGALGAYRGDLCVADSVAYFFGRRSQAVSQVISVGWRPKSVLRRWFMSVRWPPP